MGAVNKKAPMTAEQVAQRLLREMAPRFNRLNRAEGVDDMETGEWVISLHAPKLSCEARFPAGISYERIKNNVSAWAETHARKLGVKKIYADTRDEEDEAA